MCWTSRALPGVRFLYWTSRALPGVRFLYWTSRALPGVRLLSGFVLQLRWAWRAVESCALETQPRSTPNQTLSTARAYCQSLLVVSRFAATVPAVSIAAASTNRRKSPKCTNTTFDSRATAQNRSRIATFRAETMIVRTDVLFL